MHVYYSVLLNRAAETAGFEIPAKKHAANHSAAGHLVLKLTGQQSGTLIGQIILNCCELLAILGFPLAIPNYSRTKDLRPDDLFSERFYSLILLDRVHLRQLEALLTSAPCRQRDSPLPFRHGQAPTRTTCSRRTSQQRQKAMCDLKTNQTNGRRK